MLIRAGRASRAAVEAAVRRLYPGSELARVPEGLRVRVLRGAPAAQRSRLEALPGVEGVELSSEEACPLACARGNLREGLAPRGGFTVIAGPCAVEDEESFVRTARALKRLGASMLRGALFKPRTYPYTFEGIGLRGLRALEKAKRASGLPVLTEITDPRQIGAVLRVSDALQCGARNMRNYELLKELGRSGTTVLLKRAPDASVREWLLSAEYLLSAGDCRVLLCERGNSFGRGAGAGLDLKKALSALRESRLPVLADPSHALGERGLVPRAALAAAAAGLDGLMVEVHPRPEHALVDGRQTLGLSEFGALMRRLRALLASGFSDARTARKENDQRAGNHASRRS
ncbi:MAG: 3-deoxy-7-phosphoheptulonate synthase [Elusimicrobiota bacterium]